MKKEIIIAFCLFIFSAIGINAQSLYIDKLDSLFSLIEKHDKGMGNISVFHDGKAIYQNSYGFADREKQSRANADTKYRIGSISKTFTAVVIFKLIEESMLALDTKLSDYYPQIHNAASITIEDMLRHKSGIFNFTNDPDYLNWNTQQLSQKQLLNKITELDSIYASKRQIGYSNSNYVLLAFIAEEITKKPFSDLLNEYIIKPCKLKNTYSGHGNINIGNNEAYSYEKRSDWKRSGETNMSIPSGAGNIISTAYDLNVFINSLFDGKIVKKESLELMKSAQNGIGMGLFEVPFYSQKGYGHSGGIDGFRSNLYYFPINKVSVALLSNAEDYPLNDILIAALSTANNISYILPVFKEPITLKPEDLDKYLGIYSTDNFPLKITITKDNNVLIGQGSGQPSFTLECFEENKFTNSGINLTLEFFPAENKMILKQHGLELTMDRE